VGAQFREKERINKKTGKGEKEIRKESPTNNRFGYESEEP